MKLLFTLIGSLLAFSFSAFAGHETGNGGEVIVCADASGLHASAELLDFYEARVIRQINRDLGDPATDYVEKIRMAIQRIGKLSPGGA